MWWTLATWLNNPNRWAWVVGFGMIAIIVLMMSLDFVENLVRGIRDRKHPDPMQLYRFEPSDSEGDAVDDEDLPRSTDSPAGLRLRRPPDTALRRHHYTKSPPADRAWRRDAAMNVQKLDRPKIGK